MGIHQEQEHPEYVEGCDMCRWTSVSVAPSAMPTRSGGARAAEVNDMEKRWHKDRDAYKAIRAQGLQPPRIDGSHKLEGASDKLEVEAGEVFPTPEIRKKVRAGMTQAAELMAEHAS